MTSKILSTIFIVQFVALAASLHCYFDVSYEGYKHTPSNTLIDCGKQQFCVLYLIPHNANDDLADDRSIWNCGYNDCTAVGNWTGNGVHMFCCLGDGCNDRIIKQ